MPILHSVLNLKAVVAAFNQEKALVGLVGPSDCTTSPMDRFTALLTGGCILLFPLLGSLGQLVGLSLVYGLAISALVTLTSVLLVDVLGLEQLTSAFGLLIMFRGLATILGPPIAGAVYRCTVLRSIGKYV